jgi:hypothetical protein
MANGHRLQNAKQECCHAGQIFITYRKNVTYLIFWQVPKVRFYFNDENYASEARKMGKLGNAYPEMVNLPGTRVAIKFLSLKYQLYACRQFRVLFRAVISWVHLDLSQIIIVLNGHQIMIV